MRSTAAKRLRIKEDMVKLYMGIDPGRKGGMGIIDQRSNFVAGWRWNDKESIRDVYRRIYSYRKKLMIVFIEKINLFPQMNKSTIINASKLLINVGKWKALLNIMELPYVEISPREWQKHFDLTNWRKWGLMSPLDMARRLWPDAPLNHKVDDGIAVGLLLSEYARTKDIVSA